MTATAQLEPGKVAEVLLTKLQADPDQPRKTFGKAGLEALAASIEKRGIRVPIIVRPGPRGKLIIVDGERRQRASKLAKLKTVPVLLDSVESDDEDLRADQITVNQLREQLSTMEVARALADLQRNSHKSINELAAWLNEQGLPAMKSTEISKLIALVDLPQWTQDMIDAGTIEVTAGEKIKPAMKYPDHLGRIKESIEGRIEWSGRATVNDVERSVTGALLAHGEDLTRTDYWYSEPVHFDPSTVCKSCEHLVQLGGEKICMAPDEFHKKNEEAKAAGLGPGGRKVEKPRSSEATGQQTEKDKAKKRAKTLRDKAEDYLHQYLVAFIIRHMEGDAEQEQIDITFELLAWGAFNRVGEHSSYRTHTAQNEARERVRKAAKDASMTGLADFLAVVDINAVMTQASIQVAHDLELREAQIICHKLWGKDLTRIWKLDDDYLQLLQKAELLKMVELEDFDPPEGKAWNGLKLAEIRAAILEHADEANPPQLLQDLYLEIEPAYVPYQYRGDGDE